MTMVKLYLVLARMLHSFKLENPPACDLPSLEPGTQGRLALGPEPFKFCTIKRHDACVPLAYKKQVIESFDIFIGSFLLNHLTFT